jgi:NADPH:quinone reductase-like Zn-dependent oxidoreductase
MRALKAPKFTNPSHYKLLTLPTLTIFSPTDDLIRVHATSINPIDVKKASGVTRMVESLTLLFTLGCDVSGTVVQVGLEVTNFEPEDEVFGLVPNHGLSPPAPDVRVILMMRRRSSRVRPLARIHAVSSQRGSPTPLLPRFWRQQ